MRGPPSWGYPNTLTSFLLQAFACPAPWSPHYVSPQIRGTFHRAGFPSRVPPLGAPEGAPVAGTLSALHEVMAECTLTAGDAQYSSILTFGSYNKFAKPNLPELLACITLIALGPLTSQQLQLFIEHRLGARQVAPSSRFSFLMRVFWRIFVPLTVFYFIYMYLCVSDASTPLLVVAASGVSLLLSLPSLAPETLSPYIGAFLVPCYTFTFPTNVYHVVGAQILFCLLTKLICPDTRGTVSLKRLLGDGKLSILKKGHFVPFADHRSMQMIVTCVAILGVDFLTFPRRFCKSVNSGVTLMDLGVGGIIFTSGMVSRHAKGVCRDNEPLLLTLRKAALQSGPLGLFGLLRLIFMSVTNLHVSQTEYGLHWNFYMTLMVVFILGELVCTYCKHPYSAGAFGFILLLSYQTIISAFDLDEWMMEGPRKNFFGANREGILGSIGFLCVFLLAVAVGHFFVTRAPSVEVGNSDRAPSQRLTLLSFVIHLFALSLLFLAFGLLLQESFGLLPRRRFVNLSWVAFVGGIELFAVGAATTADALAARVYPQWSLQGVNDNQLIIFLLANLCVGAVNMSLRSLLQPAVSVWGIMTAYMTLLFFCGHRLGLSGRRVKFFLKDSGAESRS